MGAFPFLGNSKDAGLIVDIIPGKNYSMQVSGVGNTTGLALIEVYDLTPDSIPAVSVSATTATTDTKGAAPGVFTFTRTGSTVTPKRRCMNRAAAFRKSRVPQQSGYWWFTGTRIARFISSNSGISVCSTNERGTRAMTVFLR